MGDFDWGYENGLWGADGIPYETRWDMPDKKATAYVASEQVTCQEAEDLLKDLVANRKSIEALSDIEVKIKDKLRLLLPNQAWVTIQVDSESGPTYWAAQRKIYKRPRRMRNADTVGDYILANYGKKVAADIMSNCLKSGRKLDSIYLRDEKKNNQIKLKAKEAYLLERREEDLQKLRTEEATRLENDFGFDDIF